MRSVLVAMALSLIACSPAATDGTAHDATAPSPSTSAAPSASDTVASASPPATSSGPVAPSAPFEAPPVPAGALFVYREDDISVALTSPNKVSLVGSAKPCAYELSSNGNMYSGPEIEAAWRDAEAQAAVAGSRNFMPPADLMVSAEVRGPNGRIAWTPACGGLCVGGPKGVVALLRVLHVLAVNARGVCKV